MKSLFDLIIKEILQPYMFGTILEENPALEKFFKDFVYIHDLSNTMIEEDLTEDFEPSGHIIYNVNRKSSIVFKLTFIYDDGDLNCIDYDIKDYELFDKLITCSVGIVYDEAINRIKGQFEYFEK